MSLKPADIDNIIQLLTQITEALSKTDSLLNKSQTVSKRKVAMDIAKVSCRPYDKKEYERLRNEDSCNNAVLAAAQQEYIESIIKPLRKELDLYLTPRWPEILQFRTRKQFSRELVENYVNTNIGTSASRLKKQKEEIVNELERIKTKLEYLDKAEQKTEFASGGKTDSADLAKGRRCKRIISWIFKKTSHIVYAIIVFIGILVGILAGLHELGWLEPIKDFVCKIILRK
jgi:hypothetical protein